MVGKIPWRAGVQLRCRKRLSQSDGRRMGGVDPRTWILCGQRVRGVASDNLGGLNSAPLARDNVT